ncbi:MAG: hydrolase [Coriobacteriales bacterium]|nr:hydrolase [Coriobacteriales bacterium]
MPFIPSRDKAWELLTQYNKEPFHLQHAQTVEGVMRYFAAEHDPDRIEYWGVVGLLHDIDFELYPEQHCVKGEELLTKADIDPTIIHATMSHGYGVTETTHEPEHIMEKILFATDELTGLIGAVAIMRPSKSVQDLELKSVKKKFKTPAFAAGCSREIIQNGADKLGWALDDLITQTILAMRSLADA